MSKVMPHPRITVGCIIYWQDKVLLTKRNVEPFKNTWCFPGGHIKYGEKTVNAIKREVFEETRIKLKKPKFFNYYDEIFPKIKWRNNNPVHAIVLIYYEKVSKKPNFKLMPNEVKEIKFFSEKDAMKLKFSFEHKKVLIDFFKALKKKKI